jgi:GTP-binding protein EngB required for normal cell division
MNAVYNQRLKGLLRLVNMLRDLGGNIELGLPTVVVCGNQSVGKSSVIHALSGVALPRGPGTCTRCVIEIRLITENTWKCRLKLRTEYDALGTRLSQPTEAPFGPDISNPSHVETFIRLAQKALLNPSKTPSSFLNYDLDKLSSERDANQLRFTRNVVCIEVYGSFTNLTLVDLPGIIHTVENKDDQHVIEDIQELVKDYTMSEKSIILAVISCKDEIENQAIFHMARQVDPLGVRTVGILTKPDTIEPGAHKQWAEVLLGNQYFLKAGYYMVKCMSRSELIKAGEAAKKVDFADVKLAEEMESKYFAENDSWVALRMKCNRFGIPVLRSEIGKMLANLIFYSLPDIKIALFSAMDEAKIILNSIPPKLLGDPKWELLQSVREFTTLFKYHLNAGLGFKSFNQKIRRHFETYAEKMRETKPKLIYSESKDYGNVGNFLFGKKGDDIANSSEFTISQVKAIVSSQKGRELDGMYSYNAFEAIVLKCQDSWKNLTIGLFQNISMELTTLVNGLCSDIFSRFLELNRQVRTTMNCLQSEIALQAQNQLYHIIKMERRGPFTMSTSAYLKSRQESNDALLMKSWEATNDKNTAHKFAKAINVLGDLGFPGVTTNALTNLLSQTSKGDMESSFIELFSSAQGYMNISLQRVVDNVCMSVEYHFLDQFGEIAEEALIRKSGLLEKDTQQLQDLLKEDDLIVEKRQMAQDRLERLSEISRMMTELESHSDNLSN